MDETNSGNAAREAMHRYGYTWDGMDPIEERRRASDLYEEGHAVYMLYPDGTEAEVEDPSEIIEHEGLFGIETAERKTNPDTTSHAAAIETPARNAQDRDHGLRTRLSRNPHHSRQGRRQLGRGLMDRGDAGRDAPDPLLRRDYR